MKFFVYVAVALYAHMGFAQRLQGTVVDPLGKPLEDVHIRILHSNNGTVSDKNGFFSLDIPEKGTTIIRLSAIGFASLQDTVENIPEKAKGYVLPFELHQLTHDVIVTAHRHETHSFDFVGALSALTQDAFTKKPSRSTPEALSETTGVWVQKTNHGGGSPIIRGLMGNQVLLLMDGIRLNNATYRYGPNQYLSSVNPFSVDHIEVMRGNGSVLYGSDAVGGVVHTLTKSPAFSSTGTHVSGSAMGRWMSTSMEKTGNLSVGIHAEKTAIQGSFSYSDFGDLRSGKAYGTLIPTGYWEYGGDIKGLFRTGKKGMITAFFQRQAQRQVPRYDQVVQGGYALYQFEPQVRGLNYLRWETSSEHAWLNLFRMTLSRNFAGETIRSQKSGVLEIKTNRDEVNTFGFSAEVNSQPRPYWNIQTGLEHYSDWVNSKASLQDLTLGVTSPQRGNFSDGAKASTTALFSHHRLTWKKLSVTGGGRFNINTVDVRDNVFGDVSITPHAGTWNTGLSYKISPRQRLTLSANTGFRSPNIDDMSRFGAVESGIFEIPGTSLKSEHSRSVEMGWKINAATTTSALSIYRTILTDLIERVPSTYLGNAVYDNRQVYEKQNAGKALLYGIEAEGSKALSPFFSFYGNLTYTHGQQITRKEPMRRIPPLFGRAELRYHKPNGFWISLEGRAAGEQSRLAAGDLSDKRISVRLVDNAMPGWTILNLYAGHTYGLLTGTLSFQNIFNKSYRVYGSGVDGYGRFIAVTLKASF